MNSFLKTLFRSLIKSNFNEIAYWNRGRTITTISKKIRLCAIRFNVELRDSQYKSYLQSNFNEPRTIYNTLDNFNTKHIRTIISSYQLKTQRI